MASVFEAKTQLSELLKKAQRGETVVITSGRGRVPVARLEPIERAKKKRLGALETPEFMLPGDFFEPLPHDELRIWNEGGE